MVKRKRKVERKKDLILTEKDLALTKKVTIKKGQTDKEK